MNRRALAGAAAVGVIGLGIVLLMEESAHTFRVRAPQPQGDIPDAGARMLTPSVFSVPVVVSLDALVEAVEGALPRSFGSLEERIETDNDDLDAAFTVERGELRATFRDSIAMLATTLTYQARAWYDPPLLPEVSTSCGTGDDEPRPRLDVAIVAPLRLDRDWRIRSEISPATIAPPTEEDRDRCRVTALRFDMTGQVVSAARDLIREMGPRADSAIAEIDVREDFEEWWLEIARPVQLDDGVWLLLSPEAVARGPIRGLGDRVETTLTLRARPRVVVAGEAPDPVVPDLPPLESIEPMDTLRILAEARADYGEVAELVANELDGRPLTAGDRTLLVREVEISGVGDGRLAVRVRVTGDAEGELYLVGTPTYDAAAGQITVPDLDFDVASREALVEGAAWVARLGLVDTLREQARWPADEATEWAERQVETGFNSRLSDEVRLEGAVDEVTVRDVVADRDWLRVLAEVRGRARLVVEGG